MNFEASWMAGAARRTITPDGPIWLAGFGVRTRPSEGVLHDIHANAFLLQASTGRPFLIISADILGFSPAMCRRIRRQISEARGLRPIEIFITATHNHSCPVNTGVIPIIYNLSEAESARIDRYTEWMLAQIVEASLEALDNRFSAAVEFGQGFAGFGVNRRRVRPGCRDLPGPVDPDVPVLMIKERAGQLRGLIYGYACHTTSLSGYLISADFPGFTREAIESAHPGLISAFIPGCAGDINPLPRGSIDRAEAHGKILADAVLDVTGDLNTALPASLECRSAQVFLPYSTLPTHEELRDQLNGTHSVEKWMEHFMHIIPPQFRLSESEARSVAETLAANERKSLMIQLAQLERNGSLPSGCNLAIGHARLGGLLNWFHLGGEPVVDYALALKKKYGASGTWVSGYFDDLLCYVPSERVLEEGDYEGRDGMREYGHPAAFAAGIEHRIITAIEEISGHTLDSSLTGAQVP